MSTTSQHDFPEVQPHTHTHSIWEAGPKQTDTHLHKYRQTHRRNKQTYSHTPTHTLYERLDRHSLAQIQTDTHLHKYRTDTQNWTDTGLNADTDRQIKKTPTWMLSSFWSVFNHQGHNDESGDLLNPNEFCPIQLVLSTRVFNHSSTIHLRQWRLVPIFQSNPPSFKQASNKNKIKFGK